MKNLLSTILLGAGLFFGAEKNSYAQNADRLSKDSIKIRFECWEGSDPSNRQEKALPCFNNYKTPKNIMARLESDNGEKLVNLLYYYDGKIICENDNLFMISVHHKKEKDLFAETFWIYCGSGEINYARNHYINDVRKEGVPIQEFSSKQDIYEKFGEGFANRTKEIINARGDSLKMINLLKKEYKLGELINENGEIEKIVYKFY